MNCAVCGKPIHVTVVDASWDGYDYHSHQLEASDGSQECPSCDAWVCSGCLVDGECRDCRDCRAIQVVA